MFYWLDFLIVKWQPWQVHGGNYILSTCLVFCFLCIVQYAYVCVRVCVSGYEILVQMFNALLF